MRGRPPTSETELPIFSWNIRTTFCPVSSYIAKRTNVV
jgi:hypothetical protein